MQKDDLEEIPWENPRKLSEAEVDEDLLLPLLEDLDDVEARQLHDIWTCTGDTLVLADR